MFIFSIPPRRDVSGEFKNVPFVFVADDAFALHENMLKPYKVIPSQQHRVFNYRLSRARRIIENSFGILAQKFRIFRTTIIADLELVESITNCCVCIHNWLRVKNTTYIDKGLVDEDINGKLVPGSWRGSDSWRSLNPTNRNPTNESKQIRDSFAEYFNTGGAVYWQNNVA